MNYSALKAAIAQVVRPNDNQEITGENLQGVFNALVNSIAQGYLFAGVATPSTEPGTPDQNVVYLAGAGSYSNFGASITVNSGCLGIFAFNGEWTKDVIQIGGSVQGIPSVDIAQLNSLGTPTDQAYINPSVYTVTTLHNLSSTVIKVGTLFVFSDAGRSVVTQILFSNYQVDGGGNISSPNASKITIYYRMYNIVQGSWNAWTLYGGGSGGTIDPYPVSESDNPVASNGVFEGLQKAAPEININELDDLGNLVDMRTGEASVYTLKYMHTQSSTWLRIGVVMCFANHAQNTLTQIVFSNCIVDGGGNLIPNYATNVMNIYYRFKQFSGNPPEGMTIGVWSAWTKFEGDGDSGYQPNNEDINLNASDQLQFANKLYDVSVFSGLGRVYLRKNIVELNLTDKYFDGFVSNVLVQDEGTSSIPDEICFDTTRKMFVARVGLLWYLDWSSDEEYNPITRDVNWNYNGNFYRWNGEELAQWDKTINQLTQAMVNTANTVYIIQYDYDLNEQTITLPVGCVLEFDGGSVSFGTLNGNDSRIASGFVKIFHDVIFGGSWDVTGRVEWFGGSFSKCLNAFRSIELAKNGSYVIGENIIFPSSAFIEGNGAIIQVDGNYNGTLFTLGYCSRVQNIVITSPNVINVFDISEMNYEETYTNRLYYSVGIGVLIENVNIIVPSYVADLNNTACIHLEYNGGNNLTGFWGVRIANVNMSGQWSYGVSVYAGENNYITGCTFENIFAKGCSTFLQVDGADTSQIANFVFRRVQVQHDSTTNLCASLSRCSDFYFVNCQNWDFQSASYEINDNTCSNIVLEESGKFYSNPNTLFVNKGTTLPSKKVVLNGSAIGLGMLSQYIDLSNYSSTNKVPKEVLSSLQTGDYLISYTNAHFKALGINPASIIATTFKDGIFRITHCYARVFVEIFGFDTLTRIYACFKESETGDITWEYDNPVDIFTTAQYNALTSVNAGRIILANSRIAYAAANNKDEIRGADGARFTPTIAYSRAGLASLIPAASANYYLNNKHLIDTSTNREVIFYDGVWRDYDGINITTPRSGATSARPAYTDIYVGFQYLDTTIGKPIWWNGSAWVDATGVAV